MKIINQLLFKYGDDLLFKTNSYIKQYNKVNHTNFSSILQIKPQKLFNEKTLSYTHEAPRWEFWRYTAPTEAYSSKPSIYIDKLYASGRGAGAREIKKIVKRSLENSDTQGRVVLDAMPLNPQKGHPVGFYYKMGFRACDDGVNKACEEWIKKGGQKQFAPGHILEDGSFSPLGKRGSSVIMYLPEENVKHCLSYPDIKDLRLYNPNFVENNCTISLLDDAGKALSSATLLKDSDSCIQILDIYSDIKGKGYGTKLLKELKNRYPHSEIQLTASWEQIISKKPPHKFYLDNGFVAKDKTIQEKLLKWIEQGAKSKDFPMDCDCCEMAYNSQLRINA